MKNLLIPLLSLSIMFSACKDDPKAPETPQNPPDTDIPTDPTPTPVPTQPVGWYVPKPMSKFQIMDSGDGNYVDQLKPGTVFVEIESIPGDDKHLLFYAPKRIEREIPLFADNVKQDIRQLHEAGVKVVCYQSLSIEPWRADMDQFPTDAIGDDMDGWDEQWTDTRPNSPAHLFWDKRYDFLAAQGCDCVEDDNQVDPQDNETGFPLSVAEAEASVKRRAEYAHKLGMCHFSKNNPSISAAKAKHSDAVFIEEAGKYNEREDFLPWKTAGKFGGMIEYSSSKCKPFAGFEVHYHSSGYFTGDYKSCN